MDTSTGNVPRTALKARRDTIGIWGASTDQMIADAVASDPRSFGTPTLGSPMRVRPMSNGCPGAGQGAAVLGKLFHRLFLTRLIALHDAGRLVFFGSLSPRSDRHAFLRHLSPARHQRWVVYGRHQACIRVGQRDLLIRRCA
jgi:hypothetical protein